MACTVLSENSRDWLELPSELTASILVRLGAAYMLLSARKVCKTWRRICSEPSMWRVVDMRNTYDFFYFRFNIEKVTRKAVDFSCGQLTEFSMEYFACDEMLLYIADRSHQLRRLHLSSCNKITDEGLSQIVKKLPLLEELHLYDIPICKPAIEIIGRCCPQLKSFKLSKSILRPHIGGDSYAIVIAKNMPELHHLQLSGKRITEVGLLAILKNCPHLESLDLWLNGAFLEPDLVRLSQQIKDLKLTFLSPKDNISEYDIDLDSFDGDAFSSDGYRDVFSYHASVDHPGEYDIDYFNCYDNGDYSASGIDIDPPGSCYMDSD